MKRLATFTLQILEDLFLSNGTIIIRANEIDYRVKTGSRRYKVFKKSNRCAACGIRGSEMILEQPQHHYGTNNAHFNLYAKNENGLLILMTKDHIKPKSLGGSDNLENLQTYCSICNGIKKDSEISNDQVRAEFLRLKQIEIDNQKQQVPVSNDILQ